MVNSCCIPSCKSNTQSADGISFFKFPTSVRLKRVWESRININDFVANENSLLCSRHFARSCIKKVYNKSVLLKNSIPTLGLSVSANIEFVGKDGVEAASSGPTKGPQKLPHKNAKVITNILGKSCYSCLVCDEAVERMYEFLTDAHTHRSKFSKQLVCGHCLTSFANFSELMSHVTNFGADRRFIPSTQPTAKQKRSLGPVKSFPCGVCGAIFTTLISRNYHQVAHTVEEISRKLAKAPKEEAPARVPGKRPRKILRVSDDEEDETATDETAADKPEQATSPGAAKDETQTCSKAATKKQAGTNENLDKEGPRKRPSKTSKMDSRKKQRLISSVYCNFCELEFASLKLLDQHCFAFHPDRELPLDMVFEEDCEYAPYLEAFCSVCCKRMLCVNLIKSLLDEAAKEDAALLSADDHHSRLN